MVAIFTGLGSGFVRGSVSSLGGFGQLGSALLGRGGEGLSVNAATGNLVLSRQDEFLVGRGVDAGIARTYNSLAQAGDDRDNAGRWQQSSTVRLVDVPATAGVAGSTIKRLSGDGSLVTYAWGTRGGVSAYWTTDGGGAHDKLVKSGASWVWTDGDTQVTETYEAAFGSTTEWRLASRKDTDNNTLTFSYLEGGNRLYRVYTMNHGTANTSTGVAEQSYLEYDWDPVDTSRIRSIITGYTDYGATTDKGDDVNRTLSRTWYDYTDGRLSQVRVDLTPGDNTSPTAAQSYWTQYTYDGAGRVTRVLQKDGSQVDVVYDASGRVVSLTQTVASGDVRVTSLTYGAGFTTVTGPDNQVTRLDYDGLGQLTKVTAPPAYAGAAAQVTQFTYDADGNLTSVTGPDGKVTGYWYDAFGNVTKVVEPNVRSVSRAYDAANYLVSVTDAAGVVHAIGSTAHQTVERWYDGGNRVTLERTYGSDTASSDVAQYVRYAYDGEGHLRYRIDRDGRVTEYRYTGPGQLQYTIEYPEHVYSGQWSDTTNFHLNEGYANAWLAGITDRSSSKITLYSYDQRGNVTAALNYGYATAAGAVSTTEGYSRVYTMYDEAGRLLQRNAQGEASESFIYDGLGRLTASTDVHGGTTTFMFADVTALGSALTTTVTTSAGYTSVQTFNRAGELIASSGSGSFDVSGTSYAAYDKAGRLRITTDETGNKTYYVYDKAGQLVGEVNHYGHLAEYRRDQAGRVIGEVRYANAISAANLTALANPDNTLQMSSLRPAAHANDIWGWTVYDALGRVVQSIDGDGGVAAFAYDKSGRLVSTTSHITKVAVAGLKTTPPTVPVAVTAHANDTVTRSFYNRAGQLVGVLDGEGFLTEIVYDAAGQKVEEIAYAVATAAANRATGTFAQLRTASLTGNAGNRRVRFVYDGQGLLRYQVDGTGRVSSFAYNVAGKLTGTIVHAATIAPADYTYDAVKASVAAIANDANDREAYTIYDAAGRVAYTIDTANAVTGFVYYDGTSRIKSAVQYATVRNTPSLPTLSTMDTWAAGQAANAANRVTRSYYSASGLLRFSVDAENYVTRYDYDAADRKIGEVRWDNRISVADDPNAQTVESRANASGTYASVAFAYDHAGRLSATYDGEGNRTVNAWYANGTLAFVYSGTAAAGTADVSRTVVLDANGVPTVQSRNAAGTVTGTYTGAAATDENVVRFVYDGAGRVLQEYQAWGQTAAQKNGAAGEQRLTQYTYDGLGNRTSVTDARGVVTSLVYDERGQVVSMTEAAGTSAARTTSYTYNAFGETVTSTDPRGAVTSNTYNTLGQLTRTTDALGLHTDYTYTAFGELASVTRAGATTSFTYDKLGRVTRSTDALAAYEAYTYDAFGNRITSRNKLGGVTTYAYDRRGQLVAETLPVASFNAAGAQVAATVTNTYTYDARGNRTQMVEAAGLAEARTTSFAYDKANRMVSTTGQTFLGQTPVTTFAYDARGNMTRSTDPAGARTVYYYDDLGRVIASIDPVGTYTATFYDENGNVTRIRVYEAAVAVPADGGAQEEAPNAPAGNYRETNFTYDALGRMTKSAVAAGVQTGTFNGTAWVATNTAIETVYEYDANGNVVKATDPNGNVTFSYYDLLGRKTAQVDGEKHLTTWTYNADGNVTLEYRFNNKVGTQNGLLPTTATTLEQLVESAWYGLEDRFTRYDYDLVGNRVLELRYNVIIFNPQTNSVDGPAGSSAVVYYAYNALGQVVRKTEASGDQVNYTYDTAGRLTTEARAAFVDQTGASVTPTVDYYYNGVGDLSRTRQRGNANAAERVTTYGYDGGKLVTMINAEAQVNASSGLITNYSYDIAGRQTAEYYTRYNSASLATASYEGVHTAYDAAGRVTQKWQATYDGSTWVDQGPRAVTSYNAFGEVVSVAVGGVTQQTNKYDDAGRLWATSAGDGVWKFFGYDKNGNQTIAIASAGEAFGAATTFQYAYDRIGQANVNATYTQYDKRGMATAVTEEGRQLSVGGAAQTLLTTRGYNAFGEVSHEINALGARIDYTYNTMGRLIRSESPSVEITLENGTVTTVRPTDHYYYDASGRLVASRDANGNLTRLTLLAGSGHGGSQALVTSEIHADGGIKQFKYDIHGDQRVLVDELGIQTLSTYDRMGRLTVRQELRNAATSADDFTTYYAYDGLGQQVKHWNSLFGIYDLQTTDYDIQGRVTSTRSFGGDITTTAYAWEAGMVTSGLGTFGGWSETTTMANGRYSVEKTDLFGRATYKRDLGGNVTSFAYDVAGRLSSSAMGGLTTGYTWLNAGFLGELWTGSPNSGQVNTNWSRDLASYGYDKVGNRITETLATESGHYTPAGWQQEQNPYDPGTYEWEMWEQYYGGSGQWVEESYTTYSTLLKNQSATYDALGRMRTWAEAGTYKSPAATVANEYDAAGNVRRTQSTWRTLDAYGTASTTPSSADYWFRYDSMNRVVTNKGVLENGVIVRGLGSAYGVGTAGQDIMYNVAGQRTSVATTNVYFDGYGGYNANEVKELYYYNEAGQLVETREATGATVYGSYANTPVIPGATGTGVRRALYGYDALGRQTSQSDYNTAGTQVVYSRTASFNSKSQLLSDYSSNLKTDNKTYTSSTTYNYGTPGTATYMLGAVVSQSSTNWVSGSSTTYSSTTNTYEWYDGAVQKTISYKPNTSQSTTYTTTFYYDVMGRLSSAYINDGKPHWAYFSNDELGQIIRRDESTISGQTGSPHEVWYRFAGRQMGYTGNNGTSDLSMTASIAERQVVTPTNQGTFRNKQLNTSTYANPYADFAQSYDPINSYYQGSAGGSYTVQRGDTLQGIAQNLWGDASLWYKIAEANGLGAQTGLIEGQRLILPTGVVKNTHNAGTSRPYDPSEAIGDVSPSTSAQPKKGKKCGVLGAILSTVVAVAASYFLGPILGNIVSQGFNNLIGLQNGFSWKSLAISAISAGVTGGLDGAFETVKSSFLRGVLEGVTANTVTQGIAVATGIQSRFDWAGVAAAGLASGVGQWASQRISGKGEAWNDEKGRWEKIDGKGGFLANQNDPSIQSSTNRILSGAAGALASSATRAALTGQNFGKSLLQAIPNIIGTIGGQAIADRIGDPIIGGRDRSGIIGVLQDITEAPTKLIAKTVGATVGEAIKSVENQIQFGRIESRFGVVGSNPTERNLMKSVLANGGTLRGAASMVVIDRLAKSEKFAFGFSEGISGGDTEAKAIQERVLSADRQLTAESITEQEFIEIIRSSAPIITSETKPEIINRLNAAGEWSTDDEGGTIANFDAISERAMDLSLNWFDPDYEHAIFVYERVDDANNPSSDLPKFRSFTIPGDPATGVMQARLTHPLTGELLEAFELPQIDGYKLVYVEHTHPSASYGVGSGTHNQGPTLGDAYIASRYPGVVFGVNQVVVNNFFAGFQSKVIYFGF